MYMHIYIYLCIHREIYGYKNILLYTHTHTRIYTHTYTHTFLRFATFYVSWIDANFLTGMMRCSLSCMSRQSRICMATMLSTRIFILVHCTVHLSIIESILRRTRSRSSLRTTVSVADQIRVHRRRFVDRISSAWTRRQLITIYSRETVPESVLPGPSLLVIVHNDVFYQKANSCDRAPIIHIQEPITQSTIYVNLRAHRNVVFTCGKITLLAAIQVHLLEQQEAE